MYSACGKHLPKLLRHDPEMILKARIDGSHRTHKAEARGHFKDEVIVPQLCFWVLSTRAQHIYHEPI